MTEADERTVGERLVRVTVGSTGEEPYSLAMLMRERGADSILDQIRVPAAR